MDESWEIQQEERRQFVETLGIDYRYGCYEAKRPESCHLLGEYMEAIDQNLKGAFQIFKVNCEKEKYPHSCRKYVLSSFVMPFDDRAINDALESCKLEDGRACWILSQWFLGFMQKIAVAKNVPKALKYAIAACDLNVYQSCFNASRLFFSFEIYFLLELSFCFFSLLIILLDLI
ncbi:unnamed protein product [Dracunculus medinensis]|uniref:Uncharacterized protein n=1 Tax=Dracunculus medinensis TaxID=318479 RepID=A0A0N4UNU1_DRAME|nr:unnamed protein product [Dracunculus medinensis]